MLLNEGLRHGSRFIYLPDMSGLITIGKDVRCPRKRQRTNMNTWYASKEAEEGEEIYCIEKRTG